LSHNVRQLEAIWCFVILELSLGLLYESYERARLKKFLRALGNTLEASRVENAKFLERVVKLESENQVLRKRLKGLRTLVEEVSKASEISTTPESAPSTSSEKAESTEDSELRRKLLEIRVLNLYRQGVNVKEIAREIRLLRATVYRILKKYRDS